METFHDNFLNIIIHEYIRSVKITLQLFKNHLKSKLLTIFDILKVFCINFKIHRKYGAIYNWAVT